MPKSKNYKDKEKTYLLKDCKDNGHINLEPSNCCSSSTFYFLNKIINAGSQFPYQFKMLFKADSMYDRSSVLSGFSIYFNKLIKEKGKITFKDLYFYENKYYFKFAVLEFFIKFWSLLIPIYMRQFIKWLLTPDGEMSEGFKYLGILIFVRFFQDYCDQIVFLNYRRGTTLRRAGLTVFFLLTS